MALPFKLNWPGGSPMLAENIDDVEHVYYPMLGQPKLNGIRACWNGEHLISRQRKVWDPITLPSVFEKLIHWSKLNPGVVLDGELYCHGMPFQEIESITSINRLSASCYENRIEFHAFDIISYESIEKRQTVLCEIYKPWVAVCRVESAKQMELWTNRFVEAGFEGLMLKSLSCPYIHGRTEAMIKVKPWKFGIGRIAGWTEGKGKYKSMLGALIVNLAGSNKTFKVSGGLSDEDRASLPDRIKSQEYLMMPMACTYKYRELSKSGIPLQPQVVNLKGL